MDKPAELRPEGDQHAHGRCDLADLRHGRGPTDVRGGRVVREAEVESDGPGVFREERIEQRLAVGDGAQITEFCPAENSREGDGGPVVRVGDPERSAASKLPSS